MRIIRDRVGRRKGKQSVLIAVSTQDNPGEAFYLRVGHTNKYEIWDLISKKVLPLFEDKVNKSFVLWYIHQIKICLKDKDYKKAVNFINSLEREVRR